VCAGPSQPPSSPAAIPVSPPQPEFTEGAGMLFGPTEWRPPPMLSEDPLVICETPASDAQPPLSHASQLPSSEPQPPPGTSAQLPPGGSLQPAAGGAVQDLLDVATEPVQEVLLAHGGSAAAAAALLQEHRILELVASADGR